MKKKRKNVRIVLVTSVTAVAIATSPIAAPVAFSQVRYLGDEKVSSVVNETSDSCGNSEIRFCDLVPLERDLQKKAQEFCAESCVPYEIALAVINQESRFDENADNGSCVGLMQINRINSQWLNEEIGVTDLADPEQNLKAGIWMLGNLFEKYGEWNMVLTAYNNGETGAKIKFFDNGRISCPYSESVLRNCEEWQMILEESHE